MNTMMANSILPTCASMGDVEGLHNSESSSVYEKLSYNFSSNNMNNSNYSTSSTLRSVNKQITESLFVLNRQICHSKHN